MLCLIVFTRKLIRKPDHYSILRFYLSHRVSKGAFDQRERRRLLFQDKGKVL